MYWFKSSHLKNIVHELLTSTHAWGSCFYVDTIHKSNAIQLCGINRFARIRSNMSLYVISAVKTYKINLDLPLDACHSQRSIDMYKLLVASMLFYRETAKGDLTDSLPPCHTPILNWGQTHNTAKLLFLFSYNAIWNDGNKDGKPDGKDSITLQEHPGHQED